MDKQYRKYHIFFLLYVILSDLFIVKKILKKEKRVETPVFVLVLIYDY